MTENEITLNGSIATWAMPRTDAELGGTYLGTFTFKCYLSPLQQLQAGREYRAFLGDLGQNATDIEGNLAFALTQLKQRIISAPPFWTSPAQDSGIAGNIGDLGIIMLVLNAAMKSEDLFKANIQKERDLILERAIKTAEQIQAKGRE